MRRNLAHWGSWDTVLYTRVCSILGILTQSQLSKNDLICHRSIMTMFIILWSSSLVYILTHTLREQFDQEMNNNQLTFTVAATKWKCKYSMLIALPRDYEKCPLGSLLSFIHIMYFHFHGIRSRVEQGAPWLQ